jgi:TPR repeat protein
MLLGSNKVVRDVKKALELAAICDHEEARWLSSLFAERMVTTSAEAKQVFLSLGNDARALCFAAILAKPMDLEMKKAATLGNAHAQATMAKICGVDNKWFWAEKSARQGERDGFYELGTCYMYGYGCTKDE